MTQMTVARFAMERGIGRRIGQHREVQRIELHQNVSKLGRSAAKRWVKRWKSKTGVTIMTEVTPFAMDREVGQGNGEHGEMQRVELHWDMLRNGRSLAKRWVEMRKSKSDMAKMTETTRFEHERGIGCENGQNGEMQCVKLHQNTSRRGRSAAKKWVKNRKSKTVMIRMTEATRFVIERGIGRRIGQNREMQRIELHTIEPK
jgi:hypothetical protein